MSYHPIDAGPVAVRMKSTTIAAVPTKCRYPAES
jgi:hypothetical protein